MNQRRRRSAIGLADQQMDVLGHHHVAHELEAEAVPHLAEDLDEDISSASRPQQRQALVAGERNEVQMAMPVVADQLVGHKKERVQNPDPLKTERGSHPERQRRKAETPSLGVDVPKWYHRIARVRQEKYLKGYATRQTFHSPLNIDEFDLEKLLDPHVSVCVDDGQGNKSCDSY